MDSTAGERSALVLGATGLVGRRVVDALRALAPAWRVTTLGRRPLGLPAGEGVVEHVAPLERMEEARHLFATDAVFCCLGTTLRAAGSRDAFRAVDHDAVVRAGRLASVAGARTFLLVSAAGADAGSAFFYNRVKGEAEDAIAALPIPGIALVRPSLLLGARTERRPAERAAQVVMGALAPLMVGPLRRARPVRAEAVAGAMAALALEGIRGVRVVENEEIADMASSIAAPIRSEATRAP